MLQTRVIAFNYVLKNAQGDLLDPLHTRILDLRLLDALASGAAVVAAAGEKGRRHGQRRGEPAKLPGLLHDGGPSCSG